MSITIKKYTIFLQYLVKISIVIAAFYFIYNHLFNNAKLDYKVLESTVINSVFTEKKHFFIIFGFTLLNWFLDILKWKVLVSSVKKISLKQAIIQSLTAHTAALITPNRIGEYGIKPLFFKQKNRKKIVLVNLIHHMLQMLVTTIFGIVGIVYVLKNFYVEIPVFKYQKLIYYIAPIMLLLLGIKTGINKKIRSIYWNKIIRFLKGISKKTLLNAFILSALKYLTFVHQFIYLLFLFGIKTTYFEILLILFAFYFIASILPSIPLFDWAIKGSVAIMVLHFVGINELIATIITTIMWLLNFAIPAIIGSYFVLKFKKQPYLYKNKKYDT